MDKEIIGRCMDFCEGTRQKGQFTILNKKNKHFPHNLLQGNKIQQKINKYIAKGMTTREVAKQLEITQPAVMSHIKNYEKSKEFYFEWCEFWEFIKPVREIGLAELLQDELNEREKKICNCIKVINVGDFLMLYVKHSIREISYMKLRLEKERRKEIFLKLKLMMYNLLDEDDREDLE